MASEFTLFPHLPTELRWLIWEACIPRRIVELELPIRRGGMRHTATMSAECNLDWTTLQNSRSPIITRVCREARMIAFKHGEWLSHTYTTVTTNLPQTIEYWFSRKYDTYLWYRNISHQHNFDWFIWSQSPFLNFRERETQYLIHHLSPMEEELLYISDERLPRSIPNQSSVESDNVMTESTKDYTVCLKLFVIHMEFYEAAKSGLWGMTGEEMIQLVDPRDTERIIKFSHYLEAEDRCRRFVDITVNYAIFPAQLERWENNLRVEWLMHQWLRLQNRVPLTQEQMAVLDPEEIDNMERGPRFDEHGNMLKLKPGTHANASASYYRDDNKEQWSRQHRCPNAAHPWVKLALEKAPKFRSTVMFRLCTTDCSTTGPREPRG